MSEEYKKMTRGNRVFTGLAEHSEGASWLLGLAYFKQTQAQFVSVNQLTN